MNNWTQFCQYTEETYNILKDDTEGHIADYIPKLAHADPNLFGISIISTDGEEFNIGDTNIPFCVQSCVKPLLYILALEENGIECVGKHVGREPSGQKFNALAFNSENIPYNPLINAGAIMATTLIKRKAKRDERYDHIVNSWKEMLSENVGLGFDNSVFLSEKDTAARNFALSYLMEENQVFPENTDIGNTLDLYFQACSITMPSRLLAKFAAIMANSGLDLQTGERKISASVLKEVMCVMYSSGMYDYSGRWSADIGIPAKSGVSGAVFALIPNVCGICVFSPRLDPLGNSVRAIKFFQAISKKFTVHIFESVITGLDKKIRLTRPDSLSQKISMVYDLCKSGSVEKLREILEESDDEFDVNTSDYDGRTPLHIATEENNTQCVQLLLKHKADPSLQDRWGNVCTNKSVTKLLTIDTTLTE